ncbi:MAG TPA: NADAR family protein, partial [Cytophagales bacterium]
MEYNLEWLLERQAQGEKVKYLYFWGHQSRKDGTIGESCFSQWWQSPFKVEGTVYKTAEHWTMAGKARLFGDEAHLAQVLQANSPAEAKKIGRLVEGFDAKQWDRHKYALVVQGNIHKFSQHPGLKTFLLSPGDRVLVEASPVDRIWGIGLA